MVGAGTGSGLDRKRCGDGLQSHEPYPGVTVRVKAGHWKSKFDGMRGTWSTGGAIPTTRRWTCALRTDGWCCSGSTSWKRRKPRRTA